MSWKKFFSPVNNSGLPLNIQKSSGGSLGAATSRYASWLPEVYAGSPNRLMRYIQYDQMDQDAEINAALDTIAEFGTQEDTESGLPFVISYNGTPTDTETRILEKTLNQWCKLNKMNQRSFRIFRSTIKYGDQFFIRDPETYELYWIDPANIEKIVVNEANGRKIDKYFVKNLSENHRQLVATDIAPLHNRPYGSGQGLAGILGPVNSTASNFLTGAVNGVDQGTPVDAKHILHLSLTEGMDAEWPFGASVLEPIFKIFKQKELLEDSIIIYRVHRAPERRVFTIDVGNMPPHKARQYLEQVRYEVLQKRVPNKRANGSNVLDAAYNPMSMLEDYFFSQNSDGRGSKVDTLPGGENLGQIDDLKYFNNRLMRGLRVPSSYLPTGPDDGTAAFNDGKVGIAYIQEYRFSKYVERIQRQLEEELDREFKMFLKFRGVELDSSDFCIEFTPPMNFNSYRDLQLDSERASLFTQLQNIPYLSNQFKLRKYLGLTESEIKENEEQWRKENKYVKYRPAAPITDMQSAGIRPMPDDMVTPGADVDMSDIGPPPDQAGGDMNADAGGIAPGPAPGPGGVGLAPGGGGGGGAPGGGLV